MKRTILALAIAGLSLAAFARPPEPRVIIVNTPLPVDVVTEDVDPLAEIGPNWRHTCSAAAAQCERTLPTSSAVAIYEVFFALAPSDPMPPSNAQCFARVFLSEDGVTFREIAKFAVPANDLHSVSHVLPRPIGLQANDGMTVFRIQVGAVGSEPGVPCNTEVKLYTRAD